MPRSRGRWTRWTLVLALLALPQSGCADAEPLAPELEPDAPQAQRAAVTDAELSAGEAVVW